MKPREILAAMGLSLDRDRLILNGPTAKEVDSKAKAEGGAIPFVELITRRAPVPFTGTWLKQFE